MTHNSLNLNPDIVRLKKWGALAYIADEGEFQRLLSLPLSERNRRIEYLEKRIAYEKKKVGNNG